MSEKDPEENRLVSRRSLLRGGAIAGALGVGVAAAGGAGTLGALSGRGTPALPVNLTAAHLGHPSAAIVVYLPDPRTGEIEVFSGTAENRLADRSLAAQFAALADPQPRSHTTADPQRRTRTESSHRQARRRRR